MAERRKVRSGTGGGASTRSRKPADPDEQEILDEEPAEEDDDDLADMDELGDADEPEDADDEVLDEDELEAADEEEESARNGQRRGRSSMTAGEAAKAALREIAQLTEKQPEGITGVERSEDGWTVGIELVEDQRIPSSADILATYEATIDTDGNLMSYRRIRRYARGRADTEEI